MVSGQFLTNHNENFLTISEIGNDQLLMAKSYHFKEFATGQKTATDYLLEEVVKALFFELQDLNNTLDLRKDELLSTFVLAIVAG